MKTSLSRLFSAFCFLFVPCTAIAATQSGLADAVMKGDTAAVRMLLQQHADVNASQADGATALHCDVSNEIIRSSFEFETIRQRKSLNMAR